MYEKSAQVTVIKLNGRVKGVLARSPGLKISEASPKDRASQGHLPRWLEWLVCEGKYEHIHCGLSLERAWAVLARSPGLKNGNYLVVWMTFLFFMCAFIAQLCNMFIYHYPLEPTLFILLFSIITACLFVSYFKFRKQSPYCVFTSNYLLSTFTLLITWRISVLLNMHWVNPFMLIAFAFKILNYCLCAYFDLREQKNSTVNVSIHNTKFEWQLFFLRMLVGFIFVPHFTEKLFAGPALRMELLMSFKALGLSHALIYVYLAGIMEFAGCLAMGCGFLTRLGAICSTFYLITATYLGNHFSAGFIWVSDGGGWEYPMLWSILVLSFACFGADNFSLDRVIKETCKVPTWIKCLMG